MVNLKSKKKIHEEQYKEHLIQAFADYNSDSEERVRITTYCTLLESKTPVMPDTSYTVVYKKASIRKFGFLYVPSQKSFKERVVEAVASEVNNFKYAIDKKLKDKEITNGLLDSLDKL